MIHRLNKNVRLTKHCLKKCTLNIKTDQEQKDRKSHILRTSIRELS